MIVTTIPNGKLICQRISTIFHFINMILPPTDEREKRDSQPRDKHDTHKWRLYKAIIGKRENENIFK